MRTSCTTTATTPTSHFTGDGRITQAPKFTAFDVTLQAQPVSFTTFARSYPGLAFRGNFSGPMRIRGTMDDLDVTANLSGDAGTMVVNGNFDLDSVSGLAGRGTASVADLDVQALLERQTLPSTSLAGRAAFDVHGDSIANLAGVAQHRSRSVARRARGSHQRQRRSLTFGDGRHARRHAEHREQRRARVGEGDARARTEHRRLAALRVVIDSLGGLRPWLLPRAACDECGAARLRRCDMTERDLEARQLRDSLYGTAHAEGMLVGSIDTLLARGVIAGDSLFVAGNRVLHANANYSVGGLAGRRARHDRRARGLGR